MTDEKRLEKAIAKMEKRKHRLRENGITEPSKFGYAMRSLIAPIFRFGVGLIYPKNGCVLLGNTTKRDIVRLTKGQPVIYAPAHRGYFDVPRLIAHVLPHSYLINGVEKYFYCTINELLINLNGVLFVDREDSTDTKMIIERASRILKNKNSTTIYPEGTPNIYSRDMLKLYPGVIKIALNTGAVVVPVGNQVDIVKNKKGKIIKDINYTMYEDYSEQTLFKPSDNIVLSILHSYFKDSDYTSIANSSIMDSFISNSKFVIKNIVFDLNETLHKFLVTHTKLRSFLNESTKEYLMRCAVLNEYNKMLISSLGELEQRMKILSNNVGDEIDLKNPKNKEEQKKDREEYLEYCLDAHEKTAKKGRSNDYDEFEKFINVATDESIIENQTKKVLEGLKLFL
jgi:1-acyl-sn-glycerol-3-phosphate acyltransferase